MTRPADVPHETGLLRMLRRVRDGHVTVCEPDAFSDSGRPLPVVLVPFLRELFAHGQVRLQEGQGGGPPRVVMTSAGGELLAELENETELSISDESWN